MAETTPRDEADAPVSVALDGKPPYYIGCCRPCADAQFYGRRSDHGQHTAVVEHGPAKGAPCRCEICAPVSPVGADTLTPAITVEQVATRIEHIAHQVHDEGALKTWSALEVEMLLKGHAEQVRAAGIEVSA